MPELTARTDGSDSELHLSLPDDGGFGNRVELRRGGETVLSLHIAASTSEGTSAVRAQLAETVLELDITGTDEQRARGNVGGIELPETDSAALSEGGIALPEIDVPNLAELRLDEFVSPMRAQIERARSAPEWARADDCNECKAECALSYLTCLAGCGDPGTPGGAICWLRCIYEADKCTKKCPCNR
jgi:hypothetical protein